jgi:hypothetical protein
MKWAKMGNGGGKWVWGNDVGRKQGIISETALKKLDRWLAITNEVYRMVIFR